MKHSGTVRVALISDIHANLPAFEAVIADPEFNACEQVLFAGDLVGYYYWPAECFQILQDLNAVCIKGNHEEMLFDAIRDSDFEEATLRYGSGLETAAQELPAAALEVMSSWSHPELVTLKDRKILLSHGSPSDISQYVYPNVELPHAMEERYSQVELIVHGHTHYPSTRSKNDQIWINPGSLGQPRNRQPGAHWAVVDLDTLEISHNVTSYDYSSVVELAKMRDPNRPYLWEVLQRQ